MEWRKYRVGGCLLGGGLVKGDDFEGIIWSWLVGRRW